MPDNEVLKSLFNEFNPKLKLAKDYNEFKTIMSDEKNRKDFFNEFNSKLKLAKDYKQFDEVLGLKKKDDFQVDSQIGSETLPIGSKPSQTQVDTKPAPYVKPKVKPKNISEAVEDDNNYLGAIYNNLIGAGSDFIGGFTRLVAKSNPYGSPVLAATADVLGSKAEQVVEKLRSGSSSKQYEEKIQQGFDLTKGVFTKENAKALPLMISRFAGDLGLAIPTAGASYLAQNYNQGLKEFDKAVGNRTTDDPVALNNARELFGVAYSTISSVADKYSLGFMTKSNPVAKKVKQAILKETVQELATKATGKITADVIEETASRIAKKGLNKFKSVGLKGLTSAGVEGGTEVITGVGTDLAKMATNLLTDKNIFNKEEVIEDFWKNRLNEFGGGAVLGGITGSAIRGIKSVDDMVAERVSSATNLNNVVAVAREIEQDLITRYNEGSLDVDRYDEIIKNLNKYVKATESIPFDIGAKKRKEAIQSIVDRDRVAEEIKVKQEQMSVSDESLVPQAQQELDILEAKKQSLNDNIVEATADEKFKYSKDPEKDLYYKQLGEDGELEEISKQQYELETQSVPKEKAQEIKTLAKPTFDTEEQLVEEIRAAEKEFNETGDSAEYQLKINDLNTRLENLVPAPEDVKDYSVSEAINLPKIFTMDGEKGSLYTEENGMVVFESNDRVTELGNIDEINNKSISELGLKEESELNIQVDIDNSVNIDGNKLFNNYSDPMAAINYDKEGNVISINLETDNQQKRTIRGQRAQEIAYQYTLKNFEENATDSQIEQAVQQARELESTEGAVSQIASTEKVAGVESEIEKIETPKTKIDAVQVEAAGQVPVLTEAPVGEEVEQGKPQPKAEVVTEEGGKAEEVARLRAEEQAELKAAIPNADQYLTDGKVDENKLTDPKDQKAFKEIWERYNILITPNLPKEVVKTEEVNPIIESIANIKLDENNLESVIEELEFIDDAKRKAARSSTSSKTKAKLNADIAQYEANIADKPNEVKIAKTINDNFDKIKKDLKEQGLLNVKC